MNNVVNQIPYLRTSRSFPEEIHQLSVEVNRSYVEISAAINNRTISIFPKNRPAITGESFFLTSTRQQTLRQVYTITISDLVAGFIPHGLNQFYQSITYFTRLYGQYTDGTNWYGILATTTVAIAGQVSFYISPTNINFVVGVGAPALTNGIIILEWMSQI